MTTPASRPLDQYDWTRIAQDLDAQGWALLPALYAPDDARALARAQALSDPLPPPLAGLRADLYARLLPMARAWAASLNLDVTYADDLPAYLQQNRQSGQTRSLSTIHRLHAPGYQPLLQHADGASVFPLRLIVLLSEPGVDFTGGELVMTEQRPRMQSRPMVLPLGLGDGAVIATSHRPVSGSQGIYRVTERQAISRVRSGERVGLDLMLHDAP
ncbi:2OG-Fe(II) oxygenase [Achromobacter spanius]|uniref:2OG-Fe(II) oxygenase n=1 Tax=Achromobacter spanius TaxID=217203 RepID=UPI003815C78F